MSAAITATSAAAMSASVSGFWVPCEPCVSTLMSWPIRVAVFFRASAAIKVWAMPVGQAVTATIFAMFSHPFSLLRPRDVQRTHGHLAHQGVELGLRRQPALDAADRGE